MKLRYYIITAVVSFLFFLVINAPAAKIIGMLEQQGPLPVRCLAPQGKLLQGGCEQLMLPNGFKLNRFQWDIHPLALLLASLSADLQGQFANHPVNGHISISATGTLTGDDIHLSLPAAEVQKLAQQIMNTVLRLPIPLGEMNGDFNLSINKLVIKDQLPSHVEGNLQWRKAAITLAEKVSLGNISIAAFPSDKGLAANLSNKGGQLKLEGEAGLDDKRHYHVAVKLKPLDSATRNIRQSLQLFAKRQGDGSYLFKQQGTLR